MDNHDLNPSLLEEICGAAAIAVCIVASPLLRPWYSRWGASDEELRASLPGDAQVPHPSLHCTRAITINAPASTIWPWLVQMGQSRGGLYSYERLENLVGCDMHNADRIVPEFQEIKEGDIFRISKGDDVPHFTISEVQQGRAMVLYGDNPATTWAFVLQPIDNAHTRLIIRWRQDIQQGLGNTLTWHVFTDPITFVMERKLMLGLKTRVEARA